ncbi:16S rRNA (guanine527-N7)-methyltransferase [Variovorax boronicumulans]|uniref:Ribosomal RNA small subunit methyltransferase G n=1 Tax=Variovorax boronicumulans TaxID=436515 RepID=A0AAW8E616_9BURK|nr:16S rRNA (guanine(527)-N(7))-methyltransferase RsmG [Variovorax boronicumulans]MDP9881683.1 16S rRNA (guanine527-N7)-methyltransferase [Variovorax boronicumulans]MDP9914872.1 16S rRNA (guanine527-N7)-methyltransferase [Variovorax boronicumulans]MDP9927004.1 16S rRNA (guanine527-N7)-methyltransferase [Variovorax boronicumulans]
MSATPLDTLRAGAATLGVALSDTQGEQLLAYGTLMLKWNKVYNLTAVRDPAGVMTHHLLDSLAAVAPLQREWAGKGRLLDVGSGGGLPGVVIAIMRPDIEVSCLDAVAKKAAFVQQVAAELELPNLRGLHARVESLAGSYEVISSRAFASLPDFFNGSVHLLAPGGVWLAMKGKVPTDELAALPAGVAVFHVEQLTVPGLDAERCIVWARKEAA